MPANALGALISYMLISSFTPGPGNILTLNTMTVYGWKKGRALFYGICAGYYCVQLICAFAIYGLSRYLAPVLSVVKYVGAAYLIWLAVHIIRSKPEKSEIPPFGRASYSNLLMLKFIFTE